VLNVVLQKRALTSRNAMISQAIALLAEPPAGDVSFVPPGTRIMEMSIQDNSGMLKLSLTIKPLSADLLEEAASRAAAAADVHRGAIGHVLADDREWSCIFPARGLLYRQTILALGGRT